MKCEKHCACYEAHIASRKQGAAKTNEGYTKEKRKAAWDKRRKKKELSTTKTSKESQIVL